MKHELKAIEITKKWIDSFVLRNALCPFAALSFNNDLIKYRYCDAKVLRDKMNTFWVMIEAMLVTNSTTSNAFIIYPDDLTFDGLLKLSSIFDEFLIKAELEDSFQLVEFHPQLIFGDLSKEDPGNFVNRSPLPMIHILRSAEVEKVIQNHPDTSIIPEINLDKMRSYNYQELHKHLQSLRNQI